MSDCLHAKIIFIKFLLRKAHYSTHCAHIIKEVHLFRDEHQMVTRSQLIIVNFCLIFLIFVYINIHLRSATFISAGHYDAEQKYSHITYAGSIVIYNRVSYTYIWQTVLKISSHFT